eukprot:TRINITY_DN13272_c0_g1_i1.p1 TRINITY_DN13272_c0_g1~~TRINITY_DN13272_c0_g1_i1.p1  ORF type:complete len:172 (+),score=22.13 TRINITY_DN13272_c0_g1_i1:99-614(+)
MVDTVVRGAHRVTKGQTGVDMTAERLAQVDAEINALLKALSEEGHIDVQFQQLLALQDDSDPEFVRTVMSMFFEDSQALLEQIHGLLTAQSVDFRTADQVVHQLKGSSASFGAYSVTQACLQLRQAVQAMQTEAALSLLKAVVDARSTLQERLQRFAELDALRLQIKAGSA